MSKELIEQLRYVEGRKLLEEANEVTASVTANPELVAKLFWGMSAEQQAEFFSKLHDLTSAESYGLGEMQWCYLSDELNKDPKAKAQACAMLAWVFNRATDYLERSAP